MKYYTLDIGLKWKPKKTENPWYVKSFHDDGVERHPAAEYLPHAGLGFFHFPKRWGAKKGFDILKSEMIKVRKERIEALLADIENIAKLELPDWIP